jgi:hypothetical protein
MVFSGRGQVGGAHGVVATAVRFGHNGLPTTLHRRRLEGDLYLALRAGGAFQIGRPSKKNEDR